MAFCTKCGASVGDSTAFCPSCGTPQVGASAGAAAAVAPAQSQISENVAGLLCYALGWITGLIFYFIDKRPFVRYHAAQSIVTFGGLQIVSFVIGGFFGISLLAGGLSAFSLGVALSRLVDLVTFVLWIVLMIKAYQHDRFRVPVAADLSEKIFGKS
ncbi:MAG: zinc-ribbon domain-containing protein [Candidatus Acidiferrales bacterium]